MMQTYSPCTATYCTVNGSAPWNFSSSMQLPSAAFESDVLKLQPHACDRDYEHYQGLTSCAPATTGSYLLTDSNGLTVASPAPAQNRTRTYNRNNQVTIARQGFVANKGAGFLGTNLSYTALGYATTTQPASNHPVLCSNLGLCALQSEYKMWSVNGQVVSPRLVVGSQGQRSYTKSDMMVCGSMGFVNASYCQLDQAVNPLFYIHCNGACTTGSICGLYCYGPRGHGVLGQYPQSQTPAQLAAMATNLNALFTTLQPSVQSWSNYLAAVSLAQSMWTSMGKLTLPTYPNSVGKPTGLYYLLSYGAYEVPFTWWFR